MKLFQTTPPPAKLKPTNVAEWLEIATQQLVPPIPARIRAEIEAHYAEAVQANQARGLPADEAHFAALADLGGAQDAGKRFCREHPSTLDAGIVAWLAISQIFGGMVFASGLITIQFLPNPQAQPGFWGVLCMLFFFFVICPAVFLSLSALVRRTRPAVTRRMTGLLLSILWLNIGALILMSLSGKTPGHGLSLGEVYNPILFSGWATYGSILLFRLRKKMVSAGVENLPP